MGRQKGRGAYNQFILYLVNNLTYLVTNLTFSDGVNLRPLSLWEVLLDTG